MFGENSVANKKIELTTKAEPIFHKLQYFNGFCVSSFSALGNRTWYKVWMKKKYLEVLFQMQLIS